MGCPDTREWLNTNGLGGYASATACGANTRRYHGLLVAALEPPGQRTVLLSRFDETVVVGGDVCELGAYADALVNVRGNTPETRAELRERIRPLLGHLKQDGCIGSVSEIFDGDAPHAPNGAVAQAWSVAELLRIYAMSLEPVPAPI